MSQQELLPEELARLTAEERKRYTRTLKQLASERRQEAEARAFQAEAAATGLLPQEVELFYLGRFSQRVETLREAAWELFTLLQEAETGLLSQDKSQQRAHLQLALNRARDLPFKEELLETALKPLGHHDEEVAWEEYLRRVTSVHEEAVNEVEILEQELEDLHALACHSTVVQGRRWLTEAHEEATHPAWAAGSTYWHDRWR